MDPLQNFFKTTEDFIFIDDELETADIIFLPGNRYPQMAEKSAALYNEGLAPLILPSGMYSISAERFEGPLLEGDRYNGDYRTECDFLSDVLIKNGVPSSKIIREDHAAYTWQNARYSAEILQKEKITVRKAILCCKAYHARRCLLYYQTAFPDTQIRICPVSCDGITRENWRESAEGIRAVMGEARRVVEQFSLYM